ncbi:MAG: hypothetical protein KJ072_13930 [Verrucomicrobia bacterium]|nr:hypothetical protein [Verrucomicrobiota bacterium]
MKLPFSGTPCLRLLPNLVLLGLSLIGFDSCERLAEKPVTEVTVQAYPLSSAAKVRIESSCGAITISGWDREECKLEAVKRAGNSVELTAISVEVEVHGDRVAVRATAPPGTDSNPNHGPRVDLERPPARMITVGFGTR